jgi:hypothetical protein
VDEHLSVSANSKDISSDTHQSGMCQTVSSLSVSEAQRHMSLYFALCTKVLFYFNLDSSLLPVFIHLPFCQSLIKLIFLIVLCN